MVGSFFPHLGILGTILWNLLLTGTSRPSFLLPLLSTRLLLPLLPSFSFFLFLISFFASLFPLFFFCFSHWGSYPNSEGQFRNPYIIIAAESKVICSGISCLVTILVACQWGILHTNLPNDLGCVLLIGGLPQFLLIFLALFSTFC